MNTIGKREFLGPGPATWEVFGVTHPLVKNCTLRPEFTRGIGVISGSTGLTLDRSSIRSRLPWRPRYRSSGAVVTSASPLNVQFFTNGGVTPRSRCAQSRRARSRPVGGHRGYTREAAIRPNKHQRTGNDRIACSYSSNDTTSLSRS
jgi:hypothetical protein